jgi:membrane-bound lytic murein transglycosylase D
MQWRCPENGIFIMGDFKCYSKESKMFRIKVSMIPIILTIICFGGLTLMSCAASSHEALKKQPPPTVQETARAESPLPPQPLANPSDLNKKTDLPEKVGVERSPLPVSVTVPVPVKDPPIENLTDIAKNRDEMIKSLRPAGTPQPIPSSEPSKKGKTVKNNPAKNPLKSNPRETLSLREEETERDIMEEALLLLDESHRYWVNGELEDALQMLDQAYALLLDTNGNPDIARQKDDLRLMISKRILAIYNSLQSVAKGKRSEIPIITNADVEKEIRLFQTVERDFFISSYQRSMIYRPVMVRELKKAGLPEELSWLPLVESGYKISALSSARALGLWQFIPSTGYKYGLNRDDWVDERMDVEKSTRAAIDYFKDLHAMFGDWLTVLAGYNCGEGRVMRTIASQHINYLDQFWDLYRRLPYETARYVPRFLATLLIVRDPQKYGIDLGSGESKKDILSYEVAEINRCMRLQDIAQKLDISEEYLNILNAELRHRMTPDRPYKLKVPPGKAEPMLRMVAEIPQVDKPRGSFQAERGVVIKHKVRQGETLASIAEKYKTSAEAIRSANHLSKKRLAAGQRLNVPIRSAKASGPAEKAVKSGKAVSHQVQKGDTLASLSRKYGIPVAEIRKINDMKSDTLKIGQTLRLAKENEEEIQGKERNKGESPQKKGSVRTGTKPLPETDPASTAAKKYTIKKGDSLNRIARENNMSLEKLLTLNRMAQKDNIRPGQVILVQ